MLCIFTLENHATVWRGTYQLLPVLFIVRESWLEFPPWPFLDQRLTQESVA